MGSLALFKEGCFPARQREKSDPTPRVLSLGSQGTRLGEQVELHCPVSCCFKPTTAISSGPRPISKFICKDPNFASFIATIADEIDLVQQPAGEILRLYNKVLLTCAARARDRNLLRNLDDSINKRMVADSISRALWRQNCGLARMLAAKSAFANSILGFAADGTIFNRNPERFDAMFTELRLERSSNNLEALQKQLTRSISI